jgi:hypothetical protein
MLEDVQPGVWLTVGLFLALVLSVIVLAAVTNVQRRHRRVEGPLDPPDAWSDE